MALACLFAAAALALFSGFLEMVINIGCSLDLFCYGIRKASCDTSGCKGNLLKV